MFAGRLKGKDVLPRILNQTAGAVAAAGVLRYLFPDHGNPLLPSDVCNTECFNGSQGKGNNGGCCNWWYGWSGGHDGTSHMQMDTGQ
ncbi:MAG: hypothetical protein KAR40_03995 [Candidatus Sabulitectum sp.]|nr:hypothetical protein [Candidatus Sabulitectum sp.]